MKRLHKAAIIFGLAALAWLLLRDFAAVLSFLAMVAVKLAAVAIVLALAVLLVWLIGPNVLYRRYIAGYIRLRRMRRKQHLRQWQEASERHNVDRSEP